MITYNQFFVNKIYKLLLTIFNMNIVDVCTIIGTVISLGIILYKLGRISSKIDSNTHRLNKHEERLEKLDDRIYDSYKSKKRK